VLPIPENAFFEQAVFDQDLSQGLLELARLSLELLDLVRGRLTRRVAGEPFLARLQKLLRPTVIQVLIDPFLAAQLSNAVLATQAFQHDADLLFSGMMPACGSANIPDCLFSALRYALARLSHRCSSAGATMSQQSSLTQSAHSVRQVLTAYSPPTLDAVDDVLRHRDVIELLGHLVALVVGPGEELERLGGRRRILRLLIEQDPSRRRHRPGLGTGLVGEND